jgi:competence protein ComEC
MRIGGEIVVSDTGEYRYDALDEALRDKRDGLGAERIDVLILGHAHDDHAKNAARLLREWDVGRVVMNRSLWWNGPAANKAVLAAIADERGIKRTYPVVGRRYDWGGAEWIFAHPPAGQFLDATSEVAGNSSLVYLLRVNGSTVLFTGDIEEAVGRRVAKILDPELDERVDIFLATHHGSNKGSVQELLDVAEPRWIVLSVGKNGHGHPAPDTVARLKGVRGASIWCTDEEANGSVTARISATGRLTWRKSRQVAPWWSHESGEQTGICGGRRVAP